MKVSYFPELYTRSRTKIKIELDLSNYTTQSDFKNATDIETLDFAKKADLASLKSDIDELDIGKLETSCANLSKLSNVVEKEDVKKGVHDELYKKVNSIQAIHLMI